ncbi:DNA gyrase C-terminal beta-propeller domain-containing protein, partial [Myxococcota bacterium]
VLVTDRGQTIRTRVDEIRETGRNAQGVRVMNVDDDERVVAVEVARDTAEPESEEATLGAKRAADDAPPAGSDDAESSATSPVESVGEASAASEGASSGATTSEGEADQSSGSDGSDGSDGSKGSESEPR